MSGISPGEPSCLPYNYTLKVKTLASFLNIPMLPFLTMM